MYGYRVRVSLKCITLHQKKKQHICVVHVHVMMLYVMMGLLYHAYTAGGWWVRGTLLYSGYRKYDKVCVCVYIVMSAGVMHLQLFF